MKSTLIIAVSILILLFSCKSNTPAIAQSRTGLSPETLGGSWRTVMVDIQLNSFNGGKRDSSIVKEYGTKNMPTGPLTIFNVTGTYVSEENRGDGKGATRVEGTWNCFGDSLYMRPEGNAGNTRGYYAQLLNNQLMLQMAVDFDADGATDDKIVIHLQR